MSGARRSHVDPHGDAHVGTGASIRKGKDMLTRTRRSMADKDQGFTLIELLVVIIIIGVLAAIAIPLYLNQRKKSVDTSMKSDLKNAAVIIETLAIDNPGASVPIGVWEIADAPGATGLVMNGLKISPGNTLFLRAATTVGGWCVFVSNPRASKATGAEWYVWRSLAGGLDPNVTATGDCA